MTRPDAGMFLRRAAQALGREDRLLAGIDLRKDKATLERAYDDARGVTARFNKNILSRINRELGGCFDLARFHHRAVYLEREGRVAMYLVCESSIRVPIERLGTDVRFARGEAIHTEDSHKYSTPEIASLARTAGLVIERQWFDRARRFSVNVFRRPEA
jgi:uncharacterized SAM-dependent methyltransferase